MKDQEIDRLLLRQAETYNLQYDLQLGTYLDVKDPYDTWYLAQVIEMSNTAMRVHFDGWSKTYDDYYLLNSQKIAPLRKHTRGYTGRKSGAVRYLRLTEELLNGISTQIEALIESEFKSLNVSTFNQLIRAELFIIMDHLMTVWSPKQETSTEEFNAVLYLCNEVLMLIYKWISIFPKYYVYYLESIQYPYLYLVSLNHAIASALPELTEMLRLSFGLVKRCENTFKEVSRELRERKYVEDTSSHHYNEFQRRNISFFQDSKGFEAIINLVIMPDKTHPISVIAELLEPLVGALSLIKNDFKEKLPESISEDYPKELLQVIKERFAVLTDRDIKEINRYSLEKLVYVLNSLKTSESKEQLMILFSIAIKLIEASYIQSKLLGATMLADMIPRPGYNTQYIQLKDSKELIKVMEDYKLLEIMLGENAHPEVLRKLESVFMFLLKNDKLETKHIEMLWKCANYKYEDIIRTCLTILDHLAKNMNYVQLQELFKYIETGNYQSEVFIKFLETYTLNVLDLCMIKEGKKSVMSKRKVESMDYKLFDLDLFWSLLLDSQSIGGKLKNQVMKALIEILTKYPSLANEYTIKAAESIKNNQIIIRGIQLIKSISTIETYIDKSAKKDTHSKLEDILKDYSIISLTLNDCKVYHDKITKIINDLDKSNLMEIDSGNGLTFNEQAKLYIEFLEHCCIKGNITLSKEEFSIIWKCYIQSSFNESHADILFNSMMKEGKVVHLGRQFVLFSDETAQMVFEEFLCNSEITSSKLTTCGFNCFCSYMIWVNHSTISSKIQKPSLELHQGLNALWDTVFRANSDSIKEKAREFLVSLIDSICSKNKSKRKETTENLLETVLNNAEDIGKFSQTEVALNIIDGIIEKIECLQYEEIESEYLNPPLISFQLLSLKDETTITLNINEKMRLSNLKSLLSNKLRVHRSKIVLKDYSNRTDYAADYNCLLTSFKRITEGKLCYNISKGKIPLKETPRFILANSKLFNRLKALLKSSEETIINKTWQLILTLPINEDTQKLLKDLTSLEVPSNVKGKIKSWESYLDLSHDPTTLIYYLYVLNELIVTKQTKEYDKLFLNKGGPTFILSVFSSKKSAPRTKLNLKCIEYCVRIISVYILPETYKEVFEDTGNKFWNDIIELIKWINENSNQGIYNDFFSVCCKTHYSMIVTNEELINKLIDKTYISIIESCLLKNDNESIREHTYNLLKDIFNKLITVDEVKKIREELMNILMIQFLKTALDKPKNSEFYFKLLVELIEKLQELDYTTLIQEKHINSLSLGIMDNSITDKEIKSGLIDVIGIEIFKHLPLRNEVMSEGLTKSVLESLFEINPNGSKFQDQKTRKKALKLLEIISENYTKEGVLIRDYLNALHINGTWRTNKKIDWNITSGLNRSNNFVGLQNLGATCYMNSLLQQLFMIPHFRKEIIEVKHSGINKEANILFQLQLLFTSLMASQRTVHNPWNFTKSIRMDNRPFHPYEQKDVDEFLIYLLDHIEQELKGTQQNKLVKNIFKLTFANEIICKDCPHRSETHEEALSLILNVKNKRTIYESMNAYIQSDMLEGDNAYFCERCDKKVAAKKRQNIKALPNILLIVLKRFEFNYETMAKVKVNDYCEFPHELDLEEFTQEGQTLQELRRDLDAEKIAVEDLNEDQKKLLKRRIPKYYYKYKLKGIVVHSGHADSGHYYSYILNREDEIKVEDKRWFEFNDSMVRSFDPKDIPEEAFGGEEEVDLNDTKEPHKQKIRNAYVLIYERIVKLDPDALEKYKMEEREVDPEEVDKRFNSMMIVEKEVNVDIPEVLQSTILQDNKDFWMIQYIFNHDYMEFVTNLVCKSNIIAEKNYEKARANYQTNNDITFAINYLLTTALRAENKDEVPRMIEYLKSYCSKNIKVCIWICKLFCYHSVIQEFLIDCPYGDTIRWIILLFYYAIKKLYSTEKKILTQILETPANVMSAKNLCKKVGLPETTIVGNRIHLTNESHTIPYSLLLIDSFIQRVPILEVENHAAFFKALCYFARLGPETRKFLNECSMLGVAFELLYCNKGKCCHLTDQFISHIELQGLAPINAGSQFPIKTKGIVEKLHLTEYLFELIYRLITSAEIPMLKKPSCEEDKAMNSRFNSIEESYIKLFKDEKKIEHLLTSCIGSKVALTYLAKTLAYICFDNEEYTSSILNYVTSKISAVNPCHFKLFFRVTFMILISKDRIKDKYMWFIKGFYTGFCKVLSSPRSVECFIDFIIKLCRESDEFLDTLRKDKECMLIDLMVKWLNDNSNDKTLSEGLEKGYRVLIDSRKEAMKLIKKTKKKFTSEPNSDDDMYSKNLPLKQGEQYDFLLWNGVRWVSSVAVVVSDELVKIEYASEENKCQEWVAIDSDRIMPKGSMINNVRWSLFTELNPLKKE